MFQELQVRIEVESTRRLAEAEAHSIYPTQRGATWTYLTTDQPFGSVSERLLRGVMRKVAEKMGRTTF
jgi:hypothetical protein